MRLRITPGVVERLIIYPVGVVELIINPGVLVEQMMRLRTSPVEMKRLITCAVIAVELITNQGRVKPGVVERQNIYSVDDVEPITNQGVVLSAVELITNPGVLLVLMKGRVKAV